MAWMNQEKKAKIAAQLKKVVPAGWKYSLRVHHHSSIILTIKSAPVDLIGSNLKSNGAKETYLQLNEFYLERQYSGELLKTFEAIKAALNLDNYDRSDIQSDYFDVGHYVNIHIGSWDKPFVVTGGK